MPNLSHLNTLSEKATREYLERANKAALEGMIGLCLHAMRPADLAAFLRAQADMIEEDLC